MRGEYENPRSLLPAYLKKNHNRRKAIKKYLVVAILSALLVHFCSTPASNLNSSNSQRAIEQSIATSNKPTPGQDKAEVANQAPVSDTSREREPEIKNQKEAANVNETASPVNIGQQDVNISPQPPLTDHELLMQAAGIQQSDWSAADYIITHESSWRPDALNSEGCVGLGQRCPASLLYAECPDLEPVCQLRFFSKYAVSRYGGWQSAYNAWTGQHWW